MGSAAQIKAMKTAVGTLKADLQQFRELEAFAAFGSDLDAVSQAQLERGYRLTELLKQGINSPMPVEEQVVSIFAGTSGRLDAVGTDDVPRFEAGLLEFARSRHADLLRTIVETGAADAAAIEAVVTAFAEQFQASVAEGGAEPEAAEQADASSSMVDSDRTLPEEEIDRPELEESS